MNYLQIFRKNYFLIRISLCVYLEYDSLKLKDRHIYMCTVFVMSQGFILIFLVILSNWANRGVQGVHDLFQVLI